MGKVEEFNAAIDSHAAWKSKFRDFLNNRIELDATLVGQDNQCRLGKWLENEGKNQLPADHYREVRKLHRHFHTIAAEVINKKRKGDIRGAFQDISPNGQLSQASMVLIQAILKLK